MEDLAIGASKASRDGPPTAILACEGCKARKIRCDRAYPCAACRNSGRQCVAVVRPRLPRGRKGGRKETTGELKARINRLENLVQSLSDAMPPSGDSSQREGSRGSGASPQSGSISTPPGGRPSTATRTNFSNRLGGDLWETLASEVSGIRAVLEEPEDDEDSSENSLHGYPQPSSVDEQVYGTILLNMARPDNFQFPQVSSKALHVFSNIFSSNIDPPTKIVYAPAFKAHIESGAPYYDYEHDDRALLALKASVFYACICSMTASQCRELLGSEKELLRDVWRATTEGSLHKAEFITTTDPNTLAAFVLYLLALRSHNSGRLPWTMTAVTIRIAQAMNLHKEDALVHLPFFEAEMRRRLWYNILSLDLQFSMDRGTEPIVNDMTFTTKPPLNINDADLQPGRLDPCVPRAGFTDSTLLTIPAHIASLGRCINFVSPGLMLTKDCPAHHWDWNERIKTCSEWVHIVQSVLPAHSKPTNTYERRCIDMISVISSTLGLFVYRPVQRHPALGPPPCDRNTILALALASLEANNKMQESASYNAYAWCETGFVPWHPFAVLLAELCLDRTGEDDLLRRAWRLADKVYVQMSMQIAEGDSGPLWVPIKKLMRRAMMKRPQQLSPPEDSWRKLEAQMQHSRTQPNSTPDMKMSDAPLFPDSTLAMGNAPFDQIFPLPAADMAPSWPAGWTPEPAQQHAWNSWGNFIDGLGQDDGSLWMNPSLMPIPDAQSSPFTAGTSTAPGEPMQPGHTFETTWNF